MKNNSTNYTDPYGEFICGGICIGAAIVGGIFAANIANAPGAGDDVYEDRSFTAPLVGIAAGYGVGVLAEAAGLSLEAYLYSNAGGGGIGFSFRGNNLIRADVHKFRIGGRKTGTDIFAPHLDIGRSFKHFPIKQIDKVCRGIK